MWYESTLSSAYRHCKSSLGEGNQVPKIAYPSVLKGGKKHGMFCKRIFSPMFPGPWCDPQVQTSVGNLSRPKRKSPLWKKSYKWFITLTNCRGLLNKQKNDTQITGNYKWIPSKFFISFVSFGLRRQLTTPSFNYKWHYHVSLSGFK